MFGNLEKGNTDPYGALPYLLQSSQSSRLYQVPKTFSCTVLMMCGVPESLNSCQKDSLLLPKFVILKEKKIAVDAINIKDKEKVSLNC